MAFHPGWKMTAFVLVLTPTLVGLSVWQFTRAGEVAGLPALVPVTVTGRFDRNRSFLVDNKVKDGRPGYWVVTPFESASDTFLANRGWVDAGPTRSTLPLIDVPLESVTVTGVIWPDLGLGPLLREDPWNPPWPIRVQRLNVEKMGTMVGARRARELRLDARSPGVFVPAPVQLSFAPERHMGYAAQWFLLALVLVVGYVWFGVRGEG
ncbi:MAG: SURF1 family protein [Gammaproteobacteria bacterium]|nr:SURF1 family protein [Gammaproteobacteria bacterium]